MSGISNGAKLFLCLGMLTFGSLNTIVTKLADLTTTMGVEPYAPRVFSHPFVQALTMFMGEYLCLIAFSLNNWKARRNGLPEQAPKPGFRPIVFLLPASLDMCGTSLMYVGLTMTYASVFQMLRGSVVIFTGILSVIFLGRKLHGFHWFGMFLVLAGLGAVGVASVMDSSSDPGASNPLMGDVLVILAQIVVAIQMVVEEKFLGSHDVPALQAVGWEGLFGMVVAVLVNALFYGLPALNLLPTPEDRAGDHMENPADAVWQMYHSWVITLCMCGTLVSIAFFNYFGVMVTKTMSATTRMVLDSLRTFVIWMVSLIVGWQKFQYLQVVGFVLLLTGTCVYNKILILPFLPPPPEETTGYTDALLEDDALATVGTVNSDNHGRKK